MSKKSQAHENEENRSVCSLPPAPVRPLGETVDPFRASLIRNIEKKWVNGTLLSYFFHNEPSHWRGAENQKEVVRESFQKWKDLGIGLNFKEVQNPDEAQIKIGFDHAPHAGSWSYIGRDAIDWASDPTKRTMNFGWDLTTDYGRDTALHEIGHALGFPHEHQNPNAGIVWNEEAVIRFYSGPPNNWDEDSIRRNILNKIHPSTVEGSPWDRNSIMHYWFGAGLINKPEVYQTQALIPEAGLSDGDIQEVRKFYPGLEKERVPELRPYESHRIKIAAGEQINFNINPNRTRKYRMQTFGKLDTVMVLFEEDGGEPQFLAGDDDSGTDFNALIELPLVRGRNYTLRIRLYYAEEQGEGVVMMW